MGATSTRRTPRKSPPARKSKTPSPSPSRRKSKSPSRSRSPSPAADYDDDDGTLPISPEEKGIDFIMDSLRDNQATIIISFIVGVVSCCPAPRVRPIPLC